MKRLNSLRDKVCKSGFDALLVTAMSNVRYLTGFTGSSGFCLILEEKNFFFTDGRYAIQAEKEVFGWEVFLDSNKLEDILNNIKSPSAIRLGIEGDNITCRRYEELKSKFPNVEFVITDSVIESLRLVKDDAELEIIKKAVTISEEAYLAWLPSVVPGAVEKNLALKLEAALLESGGDDLSFKAIVASGLRSAMPHAVPSLKVIEEGDMVVVDFGVKYNGYCSDMTRTLILGDNDKGQEIFDVVKSAHGEVIKHACAGMSCGDVDALAREYIENAGWGDYFTHGTGHGVGLDIHESPTVGKGRKDLIPPGVIITVEPGIYHPDVGGVRLEDMLFVKEDGVDVLTSLPYN